MTALDDLPGVSSFFGVDLKTGSMIVAALGVVHPMAYGCTIFIPLSYLLVTIWILVALFFAASVVLFFGVAQNDALLCAIWVWYAVIFVVLMLMMMMLLAIVFTSRQQRTRVIIVILGMLWYIWYFDVLMLMMLLAIVFTSRQQRTRVIIVILGMLWYILTVYFILVVNSHRRTLSYNSLINMDSDTSKNE